MTKHMRLRNGVCLCGLRLAAHFDSKNRKLSCEQATARVQLNERTEERLARARSRMARALLASVKGR